MFINDKGCIGPTQPTEVLLYWLFCDVWKAYVT